MERLSGKKLTKCLRGEKVVKAEGAETGKGYIMQKLKQHIKRPILKAAGGHAT